VGEGEEVVEGEEVEEEGNSTYYIPVVLGVVMMVALALVTLAVLLRYTKHCYQMTHIYRRDWMAYAIQSCL